MNNPSDQSGAAPAMEPLVVAALREDLRVVAQQVVDAVITAVPAYRDAFQGPMGTTISGAVRLALDGFLELASRDLDDQPADLADADAGTPLAPVVEGAYQLGRGEARSGRTMEALLAAYRVGARVAWRGLADRAVVAGLDAAQVASFAELVFAYIDELSAASVAGHTDEAETSGRVRQRLLERLVRQAIGDSPRSTLEASAKRAEWALPETITAVLLPQGHARGALAALPRAIGAAEELPGLDHEDLAVLLVPDTHRAAATRALEGRSAVLGPTVAWGRAGTSYRRAIRVHDLDIGGTAVIDADAHLTRLVLEADPEAYADLRDAVLAPLAGLRPAAQEKLSETLRAWLLCRGRREEVSALLHVHPQTVRYRVTQLRELFGDALDDPEQVLGLIVGLGVPATGSPDGPSAAP